MATPRNIDELIRFVFLPIIVFSTFLIQFYNILSSDQSWIFCFGGIGIGALIFFSIDVRLLSKKYVITTVMFSLVLLMVALTVFFLISAANYFSIAFLLVVDSLIGVIYSIFHWLTTRKKTQKNGS
jgi:hypothetical protein